MTDNILPLFYLLYYASGDSPAVDFFLLHTGETLKQQSRNYTKCSAAAAALGVAPTLLRSSLKDLRPVFMWSCDSMAIKEYKKLGVGNVCVYAWRLGGFEK